MKILFVCADLDWQAEVVELVLGGLLVFIAGIVVHAASARTSEEFVELNSAYVHLPGRLTKSTLGWITKKSQCS